MAEDMSRFGRVDESSRPDQFVRFLDHASGLHSVQSGKRKTMALLKLEPGQRVLEVGCGTGDDARTIATHVLPGGDVVAIDKSHAMIDEAQKRSQGHPTNVDFRVGDVTSLDWDANSFDRCHAERMLIHLSEPQRAIHEMVRVLQTGGLLVLFEGDLDTNVLESSEPELTRSLLRFWSGSFQSPHVGRQLPALFMKAGLHDIDVQPHTFLFDFTVTELVFIAGTLERAIHAGIFTTDQAERWVADLKQRRDAGTFFFAGTGFLVSGRKA